MMAADGAYGSSGRAADLRAGRGRPLGARRICAGAPRANRRVATRPRRRGLRRRAAVPPVQPALGSGARRRHRGPARRRGAARGARSFTRGGARCDGRGRARARGRRRGADRAAPPGVARHPLPRPARAPAGARANGPSARGNLCRRPAAATGEAKARARRGRPRRLAHRERRLPLHRRSRSGRLADLVRRAWALRGRLPAPPPVTAAPSGTLGRRTWHARQRRQTGFDRFGGRDGGSCLSRARSSGHAPGACSRPRSGATWLGAADRRVETRQRLGPAQKLETLEEPGRHLRAGDGDADRLESVLRLELEALAEGAELLLDPLAGEGLCPGERLPRLPEHRRGAVEERGVGLDSAEEETRELWKAAERLDLLLHERGGHPDRRLVALEARLAEVAEERVRVLVRWEVPQVDAVHPGQLLVIERRGARPHALEREALDQLVGRHDRRLVVVAPAEKREVVHERRRNVAVAAELLHGDGAVPLRELAPVHAEDVRHVRVRRRVGAQGLEEEDLLRRVRDVVLAADDVRDAGIGVVHRRGEVVRRRPVAPEEDEVLDALVRHLDPAFHDVVPGRRAFVRRAQADRALVLVRLLLGDELVRDLPVRLEPVELERDLAVPVEPEPTERPLDLIDRLLDLPARVGVLDAEEELPSLVTREEPVEERGADAADVEEPGRAGREADADWHATTIAASARAAH